MKCLLLASSLFSFNACYGQGLPVDSARGRVAYTAVIQAPGASQAELYGRALKWLASLPINPSDPTVRDAASGTLAARVATPFMAGSGMTKLPCTLWQEVSVQVKDGRAKYDISDFQCQLYAPKPGPYIQPSKAQLTLTPLEAYLNKSDWHYYTKDGQPRMLTTGFVEAAKTQAATEIISLKKALQTGNDF